MPRNLDRRVELLVPVEDPATRKKLKQTLNTYFQDNVNTWEMKKSGKYQRIQASGDPIRAQQVLYDQACEAVRESNQDRRKQFEPHVPSTKK